MNKKSLLAMIAITLFACSNASAQNFQLIQPSDLVSNPAAGQSINGTFNVGGILGLAASDLQVTVNNGIVSTSNPNLFAVTQSNTSSFSFSGNTAVEAFVQHGNALGTVNANAQDGVTSATSFALDSNVTSLDTGYVFGNSANDYFVEYTGAPTGGQSNSTPFRFVSNGAVSQFSVYTSNSNVANNGFSLGVVASAIPEPSAGIVLVLSGLLALRRKRS